MRKWITATLLCFTSQAFALWGVNGGEFHQTDNTAFSNEHNEGLELNLSFKSMHTASELNKKYPRGTTGPIGPTGPAGTGFETFASYWLTNQQTLSAGHNVLFNVEQTNSGIPYNTTTGVFTLGPGVYTINYYASPNTNFTPTLNLVINGSIIPNPNLAAASIVIALTAANNSVALQATSSWTPFADLVSNGDVYYAAFASIAINQIGN